MENCGCLLENEYFSCVSRQEMTPPLFISAEALQEIYETLAALTDEQRMTRFNLKPDRSDVIVPAGELFTRVVTALHADQVIVPTIGVADGIIDQLYLKIMD